MLGLKGLTLTIDRRKSFNNLVVKINALIKSVVEGAKDKYKYKIGFSNWDVWPSDGVRGQFCDPSSSGEYPDPKQPDLQFFKMDTRPWKQDGHVPSRMITRRDALYATYSNESIWVQELFEKDRQRAALDDIYNSLLYVSADPRAEARHVLDRRNPSPPQCPGDKPDVEIQPPSIGLPNFIGKNFHPNELGHYTIASFALQTLIDLRAEVLDVEAPTCQKINEFTCWQTGGSHKYTSEPFLSQHKDEFCDGVTEGDDKVNGWTYTRWFGEGTPDETEFRVLLGTDGTGSTDWSVAECKDSMRRITHGCDGNDKENPMNWKFGGEWKRGRFTYQINPKRDNRPWPVPKEAWGSCEGWYHGWWSSYVIKGKGWATNDWGQKEDGLLDKAKGCIGGGLTMWRFKYFDKADENGNEWQADFNTPIWVRGRCFGNNKAVREAGGFTNGCGGND